jgi:large subunit ribosomal protein L13
MKTYTPRPQDVERRWYVVDADGAVLGRLASEVASILRGKHKPIYAPHADTGDHVIVVNARGVRLTGSKEASKVAYRHSGYPGGLTETGYARLMAERPAYVVEKAIRGMLPKNRLGRAMGRKLQVYAGGEHPHAAQKPEALRLGEVPPWTGLPEPKPRVAKEPPKRTAPKGRAAATPSRGGARRTAGSGTKGPAAKRAAAKPTAGRSAGASRSTAAKATPAEETPKPRARAAAKSTESVTGAAKRPRRTRAKKEKE